jgi:hypothetical protein
MTAPTNTIGSVPTNAGTPVPNIGIREDLEDTIYRVAPEETPFISNIGTTKANQVYHEWQTETLAAAGRRPTPSSKATTSAPWDAANLTTRVGNICQILWKTGGVSRTQEVVDKAGRDSELARQKVLKTIEIKRDLEIRAIGNFAAVAGVGATTRKMGGIQAFLTSNDNRGAGGSDGGFSASPGPAAATDGTQRTFTEALVKATLATTFGNGGKPTQAYMGGTHKQQFSAFTGIADIRSEVRGNSMATITAPPTCTCRTSGPDPDPARLRPDPRLRAGRPEDGGGRHPARPAVQHAGQDRRQRAFLITDGEDPRLSATRRPTRSSPT